jgi:hypothetical protein
MKNNILTLYSKLGFWLFFLCIGSLVSLSSCENEDLAGPPMIEQVRLLDPTKKDSTFTAARPGTQVLIQGQNIGGATAVYFNEYQAAFNPAYNTNENLIISIPARAPHAAVDPNVTNTIRLVTAGGETVYNFTLDVPPPAIDFIVNENALPGETFRIVGSSLWLVEKVVLPGGVEVTDVTTVEDGSTLEFIMPDLGAESGRLTIHAEYGNVTSAAPVNMYTGPGVISNLTEDWDSREPGVFNWAWWGAERKDNAELFPGTRGNYLHSIFGGVGANDGAWWGNNRAGIFTPSQVIPAGDVGKPAANYALKFEVNTNIAWETAIARLRVGAAVDNDAIQAYSYDWKPQDSAPGGVFDTEGQWRTVTIPLSQFKANEGSGENPSTIGSVLPNGVGAVGYRLISGSDPIDSYSTAFDNFRIVQIR